MQDLSIVFFCVENAIEGQVDFFLFGTCSVVRPIWDHRDLPQWSQENIFPFGASLRLVNEV